MMLSVFVVLAVVAVIAVIADIAIFTSKDVMSRVRRLYAVLVFLILVTSAYVWGFGLDQRSTEKTFSGAGVLVCAMFILHKRIN